MYDKNQIEDSLEFCRQAQDFYSSSIIKDHDDFTADDLFEDMAAAIQGIGSTKPWEKVLDEINNGTEDKVDYSLPNEPEEPKKVSDVNFSLLDEPEVTKEKDSVNYSLLDEPEVTEEKDGVNYSLLDETETVSDEDDFKEKTKTPKKSILSKEEISELFENEISKFRKESYRKHSDSIKKERKAQKLKQKKEKSQEELRPKKIEVNFLEKARESVEDFSIKMANRKNVNKMIMTNSGEKSGFSFEGSSFKLVSNIIVVVMCVFIAFCIASLVNNYVVDQTTVEGESMEPTLTNGDSVILQKISYYFSEPERYDIVVFPVAYDATSSEKTYYIKRVIGLPGETVQIVDGKVNINGSELSDDKFTDNEMLDPGLASSPITLGDDEYFVLGDNRNMSTDSRSSYVGLVKRRKIVGKAWYRISPFSKFGKLSD